MDKLKMSELGSGLELFLDVLALRRKKDNEKMTDELAALQARADSLLQLIRNRKINNG